MKLIQTVIQKTFCVKYKGKTYYIDYVNSDGQALALINRNNWEVYDEDRNELDIYTFYEDSKKRLKEIEKNLRLTDKLISFCISRFNKYDPLI